MRYQKLVTSLSLCRLNLRKIGFSYYIPLIVLFLLLPALAIAYVSYHGYTNNAFASIFVDCQKFIPFFGCWWVLFGLADYAESNVSEIIHMQKKSVWGEFFLLHCWYLFHVFFLFVFFSLFLDNYWLDYFLILSQATVFASVSFFFFFWQEILCVLF